MQRLNQRINIAAMFRQSRVTKAGQIDGQNMESIGHQGRDIAYPMHPTATATMKQYQG
jgi:hypothetical protein